MNIVETLKDIIEYDDSYGTMYLALVKLVEDIEAGRYDMQ